MSSSAKERSRPLLDVAGFGVGKSSILNEDGDGGVREGVRWTVIRYLE